MQNNDKFKIFFVILFLCILVPVKFIFASSTNGTIDSTYKYAWGQNTGWINFGATSGNVHVTDAGLTGNAWSDNYGWINLNPTNGGVVNDGNGNLSGTAWGQNIGWISFLGVSINSSGQFVGTATGDNIGTINFNCTNCKVLTDWRPNSSGDNSSSGSTVFCGDGTCNGSENCSTCPSDCGVCPITDLGTGGTYGSNLPFSDNEFRMAINNNQAYTNNPSVAIQFSGVHDMSSLDISNYYNFQDAVTKPYSPSVAWILTQGDGTKNVYVRFHTMQGQTSNILSASINLNTNLQTALPAPANSTSVLQNIQKQIKSILSQLLKLYFK